DLAQRRPLTSWKGHQDVVTSLAYAPDGKTLASASYDGSVKLWATVASNTGPNRVPTKTLTAGGRVHSVAFSPDGKRLAAACSASDQDTSGLTGASAQVLLWNLDDTKKPKSLQCTGKAATAVRFSPVDAILAASAGDGSVRSWDIEG